MSNVEVINQVSLLLLRLFLCAVFALATKIEINSLHSAISDFV